MAIGYGNNILYFFVFLLASMGMTGAWLTNKNVESTLITKIEADFLFANEKNSLQVHLQNNYHRSPLWDIELPAEIIPNKLPLSVVSEIQVAKNVSIQWVPASRGRTQIPRITIASRFPYKMLRAWKYYRQDDEVVVYPERKGSQGFKNLLGSQGQDESETKPEKEGLFRDYREFQRTDSPSRIDWKRSLKHQKHLVKNFETSSDRKILIDWDMTSGPFEDRLSQLALWVDLCYKKNEIFSLKLLEWQTDYSGGITHYKNCLDKLALISPNELA